MNNSFGRKPRERLASRTTRRTVLKSALGVTGGLALPTLGSSASAAPSGRLRTTRARARQDGGSLVVNAYGGEYQDIFERVIQQPFEEEFGAEITYDPSGSGAEDYARIRASGGEPGWDIAVVTAQEPGQGANEGLLLEITEERVPNLQHLYQVTRDIVGSYGVPHEIQYMSLVYSTENIDPAPDSWQAFWDPAYTDRVLLFDPSNIIGVFFLFMAAQVHGGSPEELEPGFAALEELRDRLLALPTSSAEAVPYMETGDAWLLPYWDGRAGFYKSEGLPYEFVVPTEGSVALTNALVIPKGAANPDLAYQFIDFWLRPEVQRDWALSYFVGPGRPDVDLPEDFRQSHVTTEEKLASLIQPDYEYIAANREEWTVRWRRIFSG